MNHEELPELSIKELWKLFESSEDVDQGEVGVVLANKLTKARDEVEAIAVAERVVKLGESLGNNYFLAEGYFWIGLANYRLDRFDESYEAYKACVGYYLQDGLEQIAAHSIGNAIDGLLEMEKYQDAYELSLEGLTLARQVNATRQVGYLGRQFIRACRALGKNEEIVAVASEVITAWNQIDDADEVVRVRELFADALLDIGELDSSFDVWNENEKVSRVLEMTSFEANAMIKQAEILFRLGDIKRALATAERALEFCLSRKLLWFSAKAHWLIADSGTKNVQEVLFHVNEGLAIVRTTSGAEGWLYSELLTTKIVATLYWSDYVPDFLSACDALISWSTRHEDRLRSRLLAEVKLLEHFVHEENYEKVAQQFDIAKQIIAENPEYELPLWLRINMNAAEIQLLHHHERHEDVIDRGLVFLSEFHDQRTTYFQIPISYETVGDAFQALGDARAVEMWTNALILFSSMNLEALAVGVSEKLSDHVSAPGQLF